MQKPTNVMKEKYSFDRFSFTEYSWVGYTFKQTLIKCLIYFISF